MLATSACMKNSTENSAMTITPSRLQRVGVVDERYQSYRRGNARGHRRPILETVQPRGRNNNLLVAWLWIVVMSLR